MSTEVLEASPESGSRNDPFSSKSTAMFMPGTLQVQGARLSGAAASCGLSPPVLSVVVENEQVQIATLSPAPETLRPLAGGGGGSGGRKRHQSTPKQAGHIKRRRKTYERNGPKPKFLLGGSITDPLNLNSLADEEISKIANAVTPACSPLPPVNKDPDPVIVPQDFSDPLKLNSTDDGEDGSKSPLTKTLVTGSGRKSSGKKKKNHSHSSETKQENVDSVNFGNDKFEECPSLRPLRLDLQSSKSLNKTSKLASKIVSPVLPDSRSRKRKASRSEPSSRLAKALLIDDLKPPGSVQSEEPEGKRHGPRRSPDFVKFKRQHSHDTKQHSKPKPKFRDKDKQFQYGNYARYYGYRNPDSNDGRIDLFKREWFEGKKCLDIGCNSGHVTLAVAKMFSPKSIVGIDIDGSLIGVARKNVKHCLADCLRDRQGQDRPQFPISMQKMYGPLGVSMDTAAKDKGKQTASLFPANVLFRCANFVLESNALLETQREEYDTILCLSVTKWVHLNWGDAGMKRFFQRAYRALHPGGRLVLEPQAWPSYHKKRKMTETTFKNYGEIRFKPHQFKDYLLSQEVGFASCEIIGTPLNKSKGFRRPLLMFTKLQAGSRPSPERGHPPSGSLPPSSTAHASSRSHGAAPSTTHPSSSSSSSASSSSRRREGRSKEPWSREASEKERRARSKRGADVVEPCERGSHTAKRAKASHATSSSSSSSSSRTKQENVERTGQHEGEEPPAANEKISHAVTMTTEDKSKGRTQESRTAKKRNRVEEMEEGQSTITRQDETNSKATIETKSALGEKSGVGAGEGRTLDEAVRDKDDGALTANRTKKVELELETKTDRQEGQTASEVGDAVAMATADTKGEGDGKQTAEGGRKVDVGGVQTAGEEAAHPTHSRVTRPTAEGQESSSAAVTEVISRRKEKEAGEV